MLIYLAIILAFNFRYKSNCVLISCFAFNSNVGLTFITKLARKERFKNVAAHPGCVL